MSSESMAQQAMTTPQVDPSPLESVKGQLKEVAVRGVDLRNMVGVKVGNMVGASPATSCQGEDEEEPHCLVDEMLCAISSLRYSINEISEAVGRL